MRDSACLLDQALETGTGKPHMQRVEDLMGKEETLATAALLAPVAGLAAGAISVAAKLVAGKEGSNE